MQKNQKTNKEKIQKKTKQQQQQLVHKNFRQPK